MSPSSTLSLSGERFTAVYRLSGTAAEVEARARAICLEQTVEFPEALIPNEAIRAQIVGAIAGVEPCSSAGGEHPSCFEVSIRYPIEAAGAELTQLLNVLFGNVALQPGVRLQRIELPPALLQQHPGPRFGIAGLRQRLGIHHRPLLCTALKPMGLSPIELAEQADQLARGGIDLIKDDHGLTDQPFRRFDERVERCAEAIARANQETGQRCLYLPNVTAASDQILPRALRALELGAGGLLLCPGLTGFSSLQQLANDDRLQLPILSHPALIGGLSLSDHSGLSHGLLFGTLNRLAGADATIFPSYGGRFSFSQAQCLEIAEAARVPIEGLRPIWPVPGGGMQLARVPELLRCYGIDSILLIGGDLHAGPDLRARCQDFRQQVERSAAV
jgi:ribulose-bisphosphate carboxylase large chain